jgi:hypothetical protein
MKQSFRLNEEQVFGMAEESEAGRIGVYVCVYSLRDRWNDSSHGVSVFEELCKRKRLGDATLSCT